MRIWGIESLENYKAKEWFNSFIQNPSLELFAKPLLIILEEQDDLGIDECCIAITCAGKKGLEELPKHELDNIQLLDRDAELESSTNPYRRFRSYCWPTRTSLSLANIIKKAKLDL